MSEQQPPVLEAQEPGFCVPVNNLQSVDEGCVLSRYFVRLVRSPLVSGWRYTVERQVDTWPFETLRKSDGVSGPGRALPFRCNDTLR